MGATKQSRGGEVLATLLDRVHGESEGDSATCEVDAMVQMGDVYALLVPKVDEHDTEPSKDELWPFIR